MKLATIDRLFITFRVMLGLLLLWAAVGKLSNPSEFLGSIYAYELPFPRLLFQIAAVILPWVELLCGLLLLGNIWLDTALIIATGLFVVFLLATGQAWARGLNISCGCFNLSFLGISETNPNLVKFVESVGFAFCRNLALTAICFFLLRKRMSDLKEESAAEFGHQAVPEKLTPAMLHKLRKRQKQAALAK